VLASMKAGDVAFFNGHVLHRSKRNWSRDRYRRSFVGHYCNARSFTQWGADDPNDPANRGRIPADDPHRAPTRDPVTGMTNGSHVLARGDTHLPFARPRFGTPCAALLPTEQRRAESAYAARMIASMNDGLLGCALADPNLRDDDDDEPTKSAGGY